MVASRFSVGTHPCLESRHHTCLDLKGITIRPTRPEGTRKGTHYREEEEQDEREHQQLELRFFIDGSSISHTGKVSSMKTSEVPVQGGNPTRPLSLRDHYLPVGCSLVPIPVDGVRFVSTGPGPSCTAGDVSGLPT